MVRVLKSVTFVYATREDRILAAIDHLGRLPHTGHTGRARDTLEWVVAKLPYVIVYEIPAGRDRIIVTGVFHGTQQNRRP